MAKTLKKSAKRGPSLQQRQASALRSAIARWPKGGFTKAEIDRAISTLPRLKGKARSVG